MYERARAARLSRLLKIKYKKKHRIYKCYRVFSQVPTAWLAEVQTFVGEISFFFNFSHAREHTVLQ